VAVAQERSAPDTYTAVTTNMTPANVELRADIVRWSTAEERAAALAAMTSDDPQAALAALPTAGVVWRSGSAVGQAIKYAERQTAADGGERITLVTDRPIGSTAFTPWVANTPAETVLPYSIVTLDVPATGAGSGMLSLGAEPVIDTAAGTVSLERDQSPPLLDDVRKLPRPYWASGN
jgi:hypothetical protein